MGLPLQGVDKPAKLSEGVAEAAKPETYYQPPLINVIKFACNACEENSYKVSDACQGCLAHPCREICPKGAITFKDKKAYIDQEKCIKCGRCASVCPYGAIQHHERPCACLRYERHQLVMSRAARRSTTTNASRADSAWSTARLAPLPTRARSSRSIQAILAGAEVIAEVAPAFVGQFGGKGNVDKLREAFKALGFTGMEEVALGADLCAVQEAEDFLEEVPDKIPFMGTSCCPGVVGHGKDRSSRSVRTASPWL